MYFHTCHAHGMGRDMAERHRRAVDGNLQTGFGEAQEVGRSVVVTEQAPAAPVMQGNEHVVGYRG